MNPPLTPGQRRALTILEHHSATVRGPGNKLNARDIGYPTAETLVVQGYARPVPITEPEPGILGILVITTAGRKALATPIDPPPRLLRARIGGRGDYTDKRHEAITDEGEAIEPELLEHYARRNRERHQATKNGLDTTLLNEARTLEERLATARRMARERGIDTRTHERVIQQRLAAIEKQIRDQAA